MLEAAEALVLHTPARSFSFLFANGAACKVRTELHELAHQLTPVSQRDVFGQFLVYLISKHDRGMTSASA